MATQKFKMPTFDYSKVPHKPHRTPSDDTWEPPEHKFFGRKRPDGKMEKEPPYVFQEYPRQMYYKEADGSVSVAEVNSDGERDALGKGWKTSPADFGIITQPSFEQMQDMGLPTTLGQKLAAEEAAANPPQAAADADPDAGDDEGSADDESDEGAPAKAAPKRRRVPKSRKAK